MARRILRRSTVMRKREEVPRFDSLRISQDSLRSPSSVLLLYIVLRSLCHFVHTRVDSRNHVMAFPNDEGLGWLMKNISGWKEVYQYREWRAKGTVEFFP